VSKTSVSVILPVYNAEGRLRSRINQWLEILGELATNFEILIVDDGSIDDTLSTARELARYYPQVRFAHHAMRHGQMVAVQTGLNRTDGEIVMVHEDLDRLSSLQVQQLWQLRNDPRLVMVHPATTWERQMLRFDPSAGPLGTSSQPDDLSRMGGIRMLRRAAIQRLENSHDRSLPMKVEQLMRADPSSSSRSTGNIPHLLVRFEEDRSDILANYS